MHDTDRVLRLRMNWEKNIFFALHEICFHSLSRSFVDLNFRLNLKQSIDTECPKAVYQNQRIHCAPALLSSRNSPAVKRNQIFMSRLSPVSVRSTTPNLRVWAVLENGAFLNAKNVICPKWAHFWQIKWNFMEHQWRILFRESRWRQLVVRHLLLRLLSYRCCCFLCSNFPLPPISAWMWLCVCEAFLCSVTVERTRALALNRLFLMREWIVAAF